MTSTATDRTAPRIVYLVLAHKLLTAESSNEPANLEPLIGTQVLSPSHKLY